MRCTHVNEVLILGRRSAQEGQGVPKMWKKHMVCSATKKVQVCKRYMDRVSEITHQGCKYLKLHVAAKKKTPHTLNTKGCVMESRENVGKKLLKERLTISVTFDAKSKHVGKSSFRICELMEGCSLNTLDRCLQILILSGVPGCCGCTSTTSREEKKGLCRISSASSQEKGPNIQPARSSFCK